METVAMVCSPFMTPSRWDVVRCMHGEQPDFAPGSTYEYSNFGYMLLTTIIEAVSGSTANMLCGVMAAE
jgi:CubicO group peptidase (beta-lactamase class C family)